MIYELLHTGKEQPTTAGELAALLGWKQRQVTKAIEQERRAGLLICATCSSDGAKGYYIPANDEELQEYCNVLRHRAIEIFKTRKALLEGAQIGKATE